MTKVVYHFEWDAAKARANLSKHGVSFRTATVVFRDPLALTVYDEEHSEDEERWVTLGRAPGGQYLVVAHTFAEISGRRYESESFLHARRIAKRSVNTKRHRVSGQEVMR